MNSGLCPSCFPSEWLTIRCACFVSTCDRAGFPSRWSALSWLHQGDPASAFVNLRQTVIRSTRSSRRKSLCAWAWRPCSPWRGWAARRPRWQVAIRLRCLMPNSASSSSSISGQLFARLKSHFLQSTHPFTYKSNQCWVVYLVFPNWTVWQTFPSLISVIWCLGLLRPWRLEFSFISMK